MVVGQDVVDAEDRTGVILALVQLHRSLVGEKRRALGKEHRERGQGCIAHLIASIAPGSLIGKLADRLFEVAHQCRQINAAAAHREEV